MSDITPARTDIDPAEILDNVFDLIGEDWMLITAGEPSSFNTMTASWGALGVLWGKKVAFCFVRPVRHTYQFMERVETFTLTFFAEQYRPALELCGTKSGRDCDKVAEAGLTPLPSPTGSVYFAEASLVLECRKLYAQDIDPAKFIDQTIDGDVYPAKDYHRMYVGEVIACWKQ
jgi:flavin reductase (DIM6/NTAB) family NADH-FMN oxidoreductase RutF